MMFSHTHPPFLSLWLLVSTVSAALLQPLQALNNQLLPTYEPRNGTGVFNFSNATTSISPNFSADLNAIRAQCNGERFGSGLDVASCRAALNDIIPDDDDFSFGRRHDGTRYDCSLPWRWLSGNGKCSFELFLIAPSTVAHATTRDIRNAAQALVDKCTASSPAKGGVASNIGGGDRLAVVMKSNDYPNVVCERAPGPPPTIASILQWLNWCGAIVRDMDATQVKQVFGPRSAPGVAVGLPTGLNDGGNNCVVRVSDNGLSDSTSWYNVWEEVGAIVDTCVNVGLIGKSSGIGTHGNLRVELHFQI